jgi:RHS repeat-associated protein
MKYHNTLSEKLLAVLLLLLSNSLMSQSWNPSHKVGTLNGIYHYSTAQTPANLVELFPAGIPNTGITYIWERSESPAMTSPTQVGTSSSYSFSGPLDKTYYFRRKSMRFGLVDLFSNVIKISLVSANWEDINYIREHEVRTSGVTTWQAVDQLAIGPKLQTTTYLDGIGRPLEIVNREIATPSSGSLWGDVVRFSSYDAATGRESKSFLSYSTTTQSGKYKTTANTEQSQYYATNYSDNYGYSSIDLEKSPLSRVLAVNQPGESWRAGVADGIRTEYEMNSTSENVQIFGVDYVQGNAPINRGPYPPNTLYKFITTDEYGKKVIEYRDKSGQFILKKVELDASPSVSHSGWICTYSVYDDKGLLRYQIQPEGVKYLDQNNWSFVNSNGQNVLKEYCFQYNYDEKGRSIWKKAPGAQPLSMIYDRRDRVVFMQDGNQSALTTPQWTANVYDELDRPVITTLYNTTKAKQALQTDINNSISISSIFITNPAQPINDIVVDTRNASISLYLARNSIEFVPGFESVLNDEFTAEINPNSSLPNFVNVVTYNNPITQTELDNSSITTILKYIFYDNYTFDGIKSFNNNFTNLTAYNPSDPDVIPISKSNRTIGLPTGSKTRILGSDVFLNSSTYYDERGMIIQILDENVKLGTDVSTIQYHFDGHILSTCNDHTASNTGYTNFKILSKNIFDKLGRITSLQKQFGNNLIKTVSSYDYDDMGRMKAKHLDPGYTGSGGNELESLNYSYNIHNQITGINKDYALKTTSNYNKWGHFFGLYIGFDNRDNVFAAPNLNGQVTGLLWNTQGDDAQRKYDYTYDNGGRLTSGIFTEQKHLGDGYSNSQMDFSVLGTGGKITYDLNGNLLNILHKGVIPGTSAPITVDNLSYSYLYNNYSNKLEKVTDQMSSTSVNGMFGDFKDGSNGSNADYVYDDNGNVIIDLNKNVQSVNGGASGTRGIIYNFLDKPELIRIIGKGTVKIVYNADGEKLQRAFIPESGGASTITTYINGYTYQESATITTSTPAPMGGGTSTLSFISFEEGRIRSVTAVSSQSEFDILTVDGNIDLPNGKRGVFDFFVMDYQQNVRMILTEETHTAANTATMETTRSTIEESIFGQTGGGNEVAATRVAKPIAWSNSAAGNHVSGLGTNLGHNIGPNVLQKVMAGDKISTTVDYYYPSSASGNNTSFLTSVTNSLAQAISGSNGTTNLIKNNASLITTQLGGVTNFINAVQPNGSNPGGGRPQAYLTILFFDERFNFISATDGGVAQEQVAASVTSSGATLGQGGSLANIKAPKNGYVYVYVSNQSNESVYFDNLFVKIDGGNIIEENHYYSYGLKIASISSKKAGDSYEGQLKNNYLYNGKELFDDGDINWYDYGFRNYDAQIGRFTQIDPLTDFYSKFSPYLYAGNDPIENVDIFGLGPETGLTAATAKEIGGVIITSVRATTKVATTVTDLGMVGLRLSISFFSSTTTVINGSFATDQIGDRIEITNRGRYDALTNANFGGLPDLWGSTANLDDYTDLYDQEAYLLGRLSGDALAILQSMAEVEGGIKGGGSLALASGGSSVVGAAAVVTHGASVGVTATYDASWATVKLLQVQRLIRASTTLSCGPNHPSNPPPANGETPATNRGREAHDGYNPGPGFTTNRAANRLSNGKIPDAIDRVNKIVRELKPNNFRAIRYGREQVKAYKKQLTKQFGGKWKTVIDTYDVLPDGTIKYNINPAK